MKKEELEMTNKKKITAMLCSLIMVFTAACDVSIKSTETQTPVENGYGKVRIKFMENEASSQMTRTVFPSKKFDRYAYAFAKEGEAACAEKTPDSEGYFTLEAGVYTVIVEAYIGGTGSETLAANGKSSPFNVSSGNNDSVEVLLSPNTAAGKGKFNYAINFPKGADIAVDLQNWLDKNMIELDHEITESNITHALELDAGIYLLSIHVAKDGRSAGISEAVHIFPCLTTDYVKEFAGGDWHGFSVTFDKNHNDSGAASWTEAVPRTMTVAAPAFTVGSLPQDPARANRTFYGWNTQANGSGTKFTEATAVTENITVYAQWQDYPEDSLFVTSKEDDGKGSLRQAIEDAPAGGTIVIDSGLTIDLASRLEINKNLTILGNGSTIKPSSSWIEYYETQLMYIKPHFTVNISRLRFNDGRSFCYGAAIRNEGNMTVDSCIFSGNKTSLKYHNGGAVVNFRTANFRGCTFYKNNCKQYGGAIENLESLTLTGNLFYENNKSSEQPYEVVRNSNSSIAIISNGYNVVDIQPGPGIEQSGWNAHLTDRKLSDLGIFGSPFINTNSLIPVAMLRNCIPSPPSEDFPETDFYGTPRTWPGAPGAVN
jgi:uncharacterized repeat protein (TIGR02543 family)